MMKIKALMVGFIGANCYIIEFDDKSIALIDPGDEGEKILKEFDGGKLKWILLTHGHADHIMAVNMLKEKFDPKIIASINEKEIIENPELNLSRQFGISYSVKADLYIQEGIIKLDNHDITILETPGHTPGSVIYIIGNYMFTGDTLFKDSIGRMDLPGGDKDSMKKTLRRLSEIEADYIVLPGHGPSTSLKREQKNNPYFISFL
ncbi:beta-lactamase domain protein [Thermodesulfobium narugense DSM 14796]|uniref:Beta-lactamase domain protein n=1 Tax=Thermodesulfobium narugense DSM 14796 TaxID=747365 RepID=M1E8P2_9BACT|nr:MBL fold metallo-hydrolase [Thermodesulfobium narugense]AEE14594.1 beta-lactamase domain protein [Thermodesulfobium narugense DSM 14796]